jgi:hypothetical protein
MIVMGGVKWNVSNVQEVDRDLFKMLKEIWWMDLVASVSDKDKDRK